MNVLPDSPAYSALQRGDARVLAVMQRSRSVAVPVMRPGNCTVDLVWKEETALALEHGMHVLTLDGHFGEIPMLLREPRSMRL